MWKWVKNIVSGNLTDECMTELLGLSGIGLVGACIFTTLIVAGLGMPEKVAATWLICVWAGFFVTWLSRVIIIGLKQQRKRRR